MAKIVLGVSGSVAAYRAADLARELMRSGHEVRVCLTDAAQKFVSVALFEALTGKECLVDCFDEPERGRMAHIDWARQADLIIIAPATANTIAKIAHGMADDMLTTLIVASEAPLIIAPAMNPTMYASETNHQAMHQVIQRGAWVIEPSEGEVACGEQGQGKLANISTIVEAVTKRLNQKKLLAGKRVLITSGPTRERIDAARFVSNRSTGKMGAALAHEACAMGALVTIVTGPVSVRYPLQATVISVESAAEMLAASLEIAGQADWVIGAAAVADYRPANPSADKIRRSSDPIALEMVPNPDIIAELSKVCPGRVVGFAAEPTSDTAIASEKIKRKGLYAIAANDISDPQAGFEVETNQITLLHRNGRADKSPLLSKREIARWMWECLIRE